MELGSLVSESLGSSGELEEVLGGLGDDISEETNDNTALLNTINEWVSNGDGIK